MRQRDPILWETMIGQHLDGPARRRYLNREYETFAGYLHGQLMEKEERDVLNRARRAQVCAAFPDHVTHVVILYHFRLLCPVVPFLFFQFAITRHCLCFCQQSSHTSVPIDQISTC